MFFTDDPLRNVIKTLTAAGGSMLPATGLRYSFLKNKNINKKKLK